MDMEKIGIDLAKARHEAGLSQRQLYEKTGVHPNIISKIEAGKYTTIGKLTDSHRKIIEFLNVKVEEEPEETQQTNGQDDEEKASIHPIIMEHIGITPDDDGEEIHEEIGANGANEIESSPRANGIDASAAAPLLDASSGCPTAASLALTRFCAELDSMEIKQRAHVVRCLSVLYADNF